VSDEELPFILLGNRRLSDKTAEALAVLKRAQTAVPRIFYRGGVLVRLRLDDEAPRVEALIPDALRGELDRAAVWLKDPDTFANPPIVIVRDILSLPSYDFPYLRGVAETPFFTRDGRLVVTPGYHKDARTFLYLPPTLKVPPVPPEPSAGEVRRATDLWVNEVFFDFPFVEQSSRAHTLGLAVLPIIRDMIDGPTPSHAIDAPMAGTGKGLLADVIALVTTGRPIEVMTEAKDNEELRKKITAVLLGGTPVALFDNVSRRLDSPVLAAALTANTWSDRVLGISKMVRLPIRIAWVVTGNNLEFSREMARRTVWVRLDTRSSDPHLRAGFKHDPLPRWIRDHRSELLWALLVIAQNWIARDRPRFIDRRLGSYEAWSETIGGILAAAGVEGFLQNVSTFSGRADAESTAWRRLFANWWQKYQDSKVDVGGIFPLAEATVPEVLGDGTERAQRIKLGKALAKRVEWAFKITGDDGLELQVRLEQCEVRDSDGRRRNGYVLRRVTDTGTLGLARPSSIQDRETRTPKTAPNVVHVSMSPPVMSNVVSQRLGEMHAAADIDGSARSPQCPDVSIDCREYEF
jgi:hypothetical protein